MSYLNNIKFAIPSLRALRFTFYTCLLVAVISHIIGLLVYGYTYKAPVIEEAPFVPLRIKIGTSPTKGKMVINDFSKHVARPNTTSIAQIAPLPSPVPIKMPVKAKPKRPTPKSIAHEMPVSAPAVPVFKPTPTPPPASLEYARKKKMEATQQTSTQVQGELLGNTTKAVQKAMKGYGEVVSLLFAKNQFYPNEANIKNLEGDGIIEIFIDKDGNLVGKMIYKSTGYTILDKAMNVMADRVSPLPPLPKIYPRKMHSAKVRIIFQDPE